LRLDSLKTDMTAGLPLCVAQCVFTRRSATPRHRFVLRYCNALQWDLTCTAWPPGRPSDGGRRRELFRVPLVAPVGHSLLFAVSAWPPQDGVRRTRCLNLSRDLEASPPTGSGHSTRSPRPSFPQERRGSALVRRKLKLLLRRDHGRCGCLLAPAELAAIEPHAVQDHCQLAGDCDTGTCHAPAFGNVHAPGAQ
jgi:hypothetical protein